MIKMETIFTNIILYICNIIRYICNMITYTIDYIENMPYDGQHQRITWDLPIDVHKNGYDCVWINEKDREESPKKITGLYLWPNTVI